MTADKVVEIATTRAAHPMRQNRAPLACALVAAAALAAAAAAAAAEREVFYGEWGTAKQCARQPIKEGGTLLAQPYELGETWLKQGNLYCQLNWGPIEQRGGGGSFTAAHAACGEDTIRSYFLGLELRGEQLRLTWGFPTSSPPLSRCQ